MEENKQKPISNFKDLVIWKTGRDLVVDIYRLTKLFPLKKNFGWPIRCVELQSQFQTILQKGFNRKYSSDYKQFLFTALGSCGKLDTQLEITNPEWQGNKSRK